MIGTSTIGGSPSGGGPLPGHFSQGQNGQNGQNGQPGFEHYIADLNQAWRYTPATCAVYLSDNRWIAAPHLQLISARVACLCYLGLEKGQSGFLLVTMPPRHGKSNLLSTFTPVWVLENWPWARIILCSHGAELAEGFGRSARDLIVTNPDKLSARVRPDKSTVDNWETTSGGGMLSAGVGGPITGRGGNVILLDDVIKNSKEAFSPSYRESTWQWFNSVVWTRGEPGFVLIVLMTRWHNDDLVGRIKKNAGDVFEHLDLPAIYDGGDPEEPDAMKRIDPLGREKGQALWPDRYDEKALNRTQVTVGNYFWNAMYQQRPDDALATTYYSGWLKLINRRGLPKQFDMVVRFWDLAGTDDDETKVFDPDYTSGVLLGFVAPNKYFIIDVVRERWGPGDLEDEVKKQAAADGPGVRIYIEQEPGSAGKLVVARFVRVVLRGYRVRGVRCTGDRILRAQPFMAACQRGEYYIVDAPWNKEFKREFQAFPLGSHDDQITAASGAHESLTLVTQRAGAIGKRHLQQLQAANTNVPDADGMITDNWGNKIKANSPAPGSRVPSHTSLFTIDNARGYGAVGSHPTIGRRRKLAGVGARVRLV
jgi:predicted phage terminase large subunit-like protein